MAADCQSDARAGLDAFRKLRFSRNEVAISYFWKGWGIDKASYSPSACLFDRQALDKLSHYHHFLNEQNRKRVSHTITLSEILTQIMQETVRHSPNGNVLEEFRAAILVTAFHVVQFLLRLVILKQPTGRIRSESMSPWMDATIWPCTSWLPQ